MIPCIFVVSDGPIMSSARSEIIQHPTWTQSRTKRTRASSTSIFLTSTIKNLSVHSSGPQQNKIDTVIWSVELLGSLVDIAVGWHEEASWVHLNVIRFRFSTECSLWSTCVDHNITILWQQCFTVEVCYFICHCTEHNNSMRSLELLGSLCDIAVCWHEKTIWVSSASDSVQNEGCGQHV